MESTSYQSSISTRIVEVSVLCVCNLSFVLRHHLFKSASTPQHPCEDPGSPLSMIVPAPLPRFGARTKCQALAGGLFPTNPWGKPGCSISNPASSYRFPKKKQT